MELSEQEDDTPLTTSSPIDETPLPASSFNGSLLVHHRRQNRGGRYRECLKNHAAALGWTATDGCGEFIAGGAPGTMEALKCSACGCHRNFHRPEVAPEEPSPSVPRFHFHGFLMPRPVAAAAPPRIMPLGAPEPAPAGKEAPKKRPRTKFTAEQKQRMQGFAEKVGWRLQREEERVVQQFCEEIGVKRRVLKVWMHNHRNKSMAKIE